MLRLRREVLTVSLIRWTVISIALLRTWSKFVVQDFGINAARLDGMLRWISSPLRKIQLTSLNSFAGDCGRRFDKITNTIELLATVQETKIVWRLDGCVVMMKQGLGILTQCIQRYGFRQLQLVRIHDFLQLLWSDIALSMRRIRSVVLL